MHLPISKGRGLCAAPNVILSFFANHSASHFIVPFQPPFSRGAQLPSTLEAAEEKTPNPSQFVVQEVLGPTSGPTISASECRTGLFENFVAVELSCHFETPISGQHCAVTRLALDEFAINESRDLTSPMLCQMPSCGLSSAERSSPRRPHGRTNGFLLSPLCVGLCQDCLLLEVSSHTNHGPVAPIQCLAPPDDSVSLPRQRDPYGRSLLLDPPEHAAFAHRSSALGTSSSSYRTKVAAQKNTLLQQPWEWRRKSSIYPRVVLIWSERVCCHFKSSSSSTNRETSTLQQTVTQLLQQLAATACYNRGPTAQLASNRKLV
ncbi:hypothetical protein VTI74DRAFT_5283 [Chaetomium olivicolor]